MENEEIKECPHCKRKAQEEAESDELNFAVLVALVPIMTITLLSNMGLF